MESGHMHVVSINRGRGEHLRHRSFDGVTGIFKQPVEGPVAIGTLGVEADAIMDQKHHGGPDQAVYLYRQEDYDWWSAELGRPIAPGTFGDNLTVAGLPGPGALIGSRFDFGDVVLEVTAPRIPCNTLAARMDDPTFAKRFMAADRPGIYCRVIRPGTLVAGATFTVTPFAGESVSTLDIFRARYRRPDNAELQRFLTAPLDERTRAKYEAELASRATSRVRAGTAPIVLITGAPGAGKSTVARALADASPYPRAVHLHADDFYAYIRTGFVEPWRKESRKQNGVIMKALAATARQYAAGGYEVLVDGIFGPWFIAPWAALARAGLDVRYVVLRADEATTVERAIARDPATAMVDPAVVTQMWRQFAELGEYEAFVINTSNKSPDTTVTELRGRLARDELRLLVTRRAR
jgi:MOSC domain-containing protein YiiM/uridine kinase